MSPSDTRMASIAEYASADDQQLTPGGPAEGDAATVPSHFPLNEPAQSQFVARLQGATEDADPVAGVETAIRMTPDEIDRSRRVPSDRAPPSDAGAQMDAAVDILARVVLEADDPVEALDQGAEALAEALAARDMAAKEQRRAAQERRIHEQGAYRHARFHRVTELIDLGYSLDQAVAITNANEAEIRTRAAAAGHDPMELIYQHATRNGYQGIRAPLPELPEGRRAGAAATQDHRGSQAPTLEVLAAMSDEDFAETTKGARWEKLLRAQS